jgi:hypothetical protein
VCHDEFSLISLALLKVIFFLEIPAHEISRPAAKRRGGGPRLCERQQCDKVGRLAGNGSI